MISATEQVVYHSGGETVRCVSCEMELSSSEGYCYNCQTPLELSRTVAARGTPPRFVPVLGASGAGKTVYIGMLLDMLTKGCGGLTGLANSAVSVTVQEQTVMSLEARTFPEKTASEVDMWQWVHCEVRNAKKPKNFVDLVTPDFAGEAIAIAIDQANMFPVIRSAVEKSAAVLLLCDSMRVRDEGAVEDIFAMKMAAYVSEILARSKSSRGQQKLNLPVGIVFTKCDGCPEALEDPARFATSNTPRLLQYCQRSFKHFQFFSVSVVGSSGMLVDNFGRQMQVPLHVEPVGITAPLQWLMQYN